MKKSFILWIAMLITCMASAQVSTWDGTWEPWTHGTGTEADPFLIENAQQLAYLAYRVNNGLDANGGHVSNHDLHYKLMVDVDLNGSESFQWTPIGYWNSDTDYQCFGGRFDGNNHLISRLYINSSANRVGLFGNVDGVTINNFSVSGEKIATTGQYAGGVIGVAVGEITISNCYNMGNICSNVSLSSYDPYSSSSSYSYSYSGGIVGYAFGITTITKCYNIGNIYSHDYCYNYPNSAFSYSYSGGIIGCTSNSATITDCYNTGNITSVSDANSGFHNAYSHSYSYSGSILGYTSNPQIINCYGTGNVSSSAYYDCYSNHYVSSSNPGGIVGFKNNGTVTNSYYLNTCGGSNNSGGLSMSADAMKSVEFVNTLNSISNTWKRDIYNVNEGYPIFEGVLYMKLSTTNATDITQTHTTLNGSAYSTTDHISSGFEYKKSSDSHYHTVNVSTNGNISTTLSGLQPNTQYQYHSFCTLNSLSTYYGEEKTFTTLPVSVTTYPATNVTATSAVLHGSMNIGDATLVSKGFIYFEDENPNSAVTIYAEGNDSDFTIQLTELQVNTTYIYQAFLNIAENPSTYYAPTGYSFEVSWLLQDTIYIYDVDMLHWVAEQCNSGTTFQGKCIKLMDDITLPLNVPNNMTSIGSYPNHPFKGTFDGNGKLITNLYIDQPNTPYQGFFGYTLNANLYNVGLVNITASGRNHTGGMVAYAANTYMRDCYVNGGTLFALSYCGGLVGYQDQGTNSIISGCYNTCEVTGNNYVGGLIGFSNYSTVRNSYVAGRVSAQGDAVGAIIGGANEVLMYYCYFSTEITGQTNAIGENNTGGGKDGGEGLTNAQMRDPQFVNTLNQGLVTPVWMADYATHINNGFPIIKWQRPGTGVEENVTTKNYISLYPNPANGFVTIQSDDSSVSLKHVEVYDVMGRKVMSEVLNGQSQRFSIEKLPAGIYNVRIQTDNRCNTNLKLVVQ